MMEGSTESAKENDKGWGEHTWLCVFPVKLEGWGQIKSFEVNISPAEVPVLKSGGITVCICPSQFWANIFVLCSDCSHLEWHFCSVSVCGANSHLFI